MDMDWWWSSEKKWRASFAALLLVAAWTLLYIAVGVLSVEATIDDFLEAEAAYARAQQENNPFVPQPYLSDLVVVVTRDSVSTVFFSAGVMCYIYVAAKAARPAQLHLHGLLIIIATLEQLGWMLTGRLFASFDVENALIVAAITQLPYIPRRVLFYKLSLQKILVLRQAGKRFADISACVNIAMAWTCLYATTTAARFAHQLSIIWRGELRDYEVLALTTDGDPRLSHADNFCLLLFPNVLRAGACGTTVFNIGFMAVAASQIGLVAAKLRGRRVQVEAMMAVRRTLQQHLVGIVVNLTSWSWVLMVGPFTDIVLRRTRDQSPLDVLITVDNIGDVVGMLFLSGIGVLLFREDPDAGNVKGRIKDLLQAAVLTTRADVVFEGRVTVTPSRRCIVSFPGRYTEVWNALTWRCEEGDLSSACVFLPTSDPQRRFGQHCPCPENPGRCWCPDLYGEVKPWGCQWFEAWRVNVEHAVSLGLELVVVFFPGEVGQGVVEWADLPTANLWDGVGLGGSHKGEVAFLRRQGFRYVEEDVMISRREITTTRTS